MTDRPKGTAIRLAAEFLVIVIGVLVALAVDAWAQARQDSVRELAYLRDLSDELQASIETGSAVVESETQLREYLFSLSDALHEGQPASADSLAFWFENTLRSTSYRPASAIADALVETGDLSLIRDPDIRRLIIEYRGQAQQMRDVVNVFDASSLEAVASINRRVDRRAIRQNSLDQVEWQRIASDPVVRGDLGTHGIAVSARLANARGLVDVARKLREEVAAELTSRGSHSGDAR